MDLRMKKLPFFKPSFKKILLFFLGEFGSKSSGQALLIIVLIMAVGLTIGLAVVSRSVSNIKISEQTEEASRAFSAAEAGIEEALKSLTIGTFEGELTSESRYKTTVVMVGEGVQQFIFPQEIQVDKPETVYLARYNTDGTLTQFYTGNSIDVCWNGNAAIEASLYYNSGGYKVARYVVDPVSNRTPGAELPSSGSCAGLTRKKTLTLPSGVGVTLLFLRLKVLYEKAKVGVVAQSGKTLPSQGVKIESTGTAGSSTRKIEVFRSYPVPPAILDFALYSGGNLSK
jgi:Tfp pilus assembly protein PilX